MQLEQLKPDLKWYNDQVLRRGREKPFTDKQHAFLYLMFGEDYKLFLPSENGHKPLGKKILKP